LDRQQSWTIGRIIYTFLMALLLLGYLAVIATYCDQTATGKAFNFPGFVWVLRVITGVMAIYLGKLWKDKGFLLLAVYLLMKLVRVVAEGPDNVFQDSVSDAILTGFWAFSACYGMARILSKKQLKSFLNICITIWTIGMVVSSCLGIYAVWTGNNIYTIGEGAIWGVTHENRLFLVFYPTVSGSVASFSLLLALCGSIVGKTRKVKAFFLLSIIPMFIALCLTDSRCAQVTVSAGVATMLGIFIIRKLRDQAQQKNRNSWYAWATGIAVAGVVFVVSVMLCMKTITAFNQVRANGLLIPRALAEEVQTKAIVSNRGYGGRNLLTDRPMIWNAAIQVLWNNPLFLLWGTSIWNPMTLVNASETMTFMANHCHCMPLMILLENGIPGLLLMGTFLGKMVSASFRLVLTSKEKREVVIVPFILSILLGEIIECFLWLRTGTCPTMPFFFVAVGILLTTGQKQKSVSEGMTD